MQKNCNMSLKITFWATFLVCFVANQAVAQTPQPLNYVNTLMGSDSEKMLSNGNTYPAIALPWGMNF